MTLTEQRIYSPNTSTTNADDQDPAQFSVDGVPLGISVSKLIADFGMPKEASVLLEPTLQAQSDLVVDARKVEQRVGSSIAGHRLLRKATAGEVSLPLDTAVPGDSEDAPDHTVAELLQIGFFRRVQTELENIQTIANTELGVPLEEPEHSGIVDRLGRLVSAEKRYAHHVRLAEQEQAHAESRKRAEQQRSKRVKEASNEVARLLKRLGRDPERVLVESLPDDDLERTAAFVIAEKIIQLPDRKAAERTNPDQVPGSGMSPEEYAAWKERMNRKKAAKDSKAAARQSSTAVQTQEEEAPSNTPVGTDSIDGMKAATTQQHITAEKVEATPMDTLVSNIHNTIKERVSKNNDTLSLLEIERMNRTQMLLAEALRAKTPQERDETVRHIYQAASVGRNGQFTQRFGDLVRGTVVEMIVREELETALEAIEIPGTRLTFKQSERKEDIEEGFDYTVTVMRDGGAKSRPIHIDAKSSRIFNTVMGNGSSMQYDDYTGVTLKKDRGVLIVNPLGRPGDEGTSITAFHDLDGVNIPSFVRNQENVMHLQRSLQGALREQIHLLFPGTTAPIYQAR